MNDTPRVGAYVLETLTTGMYTNPLDALREYIQNAADSIRRAEQNGGLRPGGGRVDVVIDPAKRRLVVRDNGGGVPTEMAHARLVNIGMSDKEIGVDAGFRGIGRLAGMAYCDRVSFRTSAAGESAESVVEFDCRGLRTAISPATRHLEELGPLLGRFARVEHKARQAGDAYFEVTMDGIAESADVFLDWQGLEKYLGQVAPVEYDTHSFVLAPKITEWARTHGLVIPHVTLVLTSTPAIERQVFKPYKGRYRTCRDNHEIEVKDICFFPEDPGPDCQFWVWYGKTDLLGMFDDERAAGLRLRMHNIAVGGPERMAELFGENAESNARFNAWYIGEVHVASANVIPNARRDGFEDVGAWPAVREQLMSFVRERCAEIRALSDARNRPTAKVVAGARETLKKVSERLDLGLVSPEERQKLVDKVCREEERAKIALGGRRDDEGSNEIRLVLDELVVARERLDGVSEFGVKRLRSDLDRKQRKVIATVLRVLQETLDESNFAKAQAAICAEFRISDKDAG